MDEHSCLCAFRRHCKCSADALLAAGFLTLKESNGKASELCFSVAIALPETVTTAEISCWPHVPLRFVLLIHTVLFHFLNFIAEQSH